MGGSATFHDTNAGLFRRRDVFCRLIFLLCLATSYLFCNTGYCQDILPPTTPPKIPKGGENNEQGDESEAKAPPPAPLKTGILKLMLKHENGTPCAGRISIRQPNGEYAGALPGMTYFWANREFQIRLPEGNNVVKASFGLRSFNWDDSVYISADSPMALDIIKRDYGQVYRAGWRSCDPYAAMQPNTNPDSGYFCATMEEAALMARGEGIDVLGAGEAWNLQASAGNPFPKSEQGCQQLTKALESENTGGFLAVLARRGKGGNASSFYSLELEPALPRQQARTGSTIFQRLSAIRDRGGIAVINNPVGFLTSDGVKSGIAEFPFDLLSGKIFDALDIGGGENNIDLWYMLLNHGYRITALSGGPGPEPKSSLQEIPQTGCYVFLPEDTLSPNDFFRNIRNGRVIASNGPFVRIIVDGIIKVGGVIPPTTGKRRIFIEAIACSDPKDSVEKVDLILNGKTIRTWQGEKEQKSMQIQTSLNLPNVGWIAARYRSTAIDRWAITNPIYIRSGHYGTQNAVVAKVVASLHDKDSGRPLGGTIRAYNFGVFIGEWETGANNIRIEVPATASLVFAAPGYTEQQKSIYIDGGIKEFLESEVQKQSITNTLTDWKTYMGTAQKLQNVRIRAHMDTE